MAKKKKKERKKKKLKQKKSSLSKKLINFAKSKRQRKKVIFLSVLIAFSVWLFWGIPLPTNLDSKDFPVSTKLFDRNGKLIFEIYADKRSTPQKLDELPQHVVQATLAIEDKDYYKN